MTEEKAIRQEALNQWSVEGIISKRRKTRLEHDFAERIKKHEGPIFRPLPYRETNNKELDREASLFIDAFDLLPERPDLAFDVVWRAFESALSRKFPNVNQVTRQLEEFTSQHSSRLSEILLADVPFQVAKSIHKVIHTPSPHYPRVANRINTISNLDAGVRPFLDEVTSSPSSIDSNERRREIAKLKRLLEGKPVDVNTQQIVPDPKTPLRILCSIGIYSNRNARTHSDFTAPFTSSKSNLRLYLFYYFLLLVVYHLTLTTWENGGNHLYTEDEIIKSATTNLDELKRLFGNHWGR